MHSYHSLKQKAGHRVSQTIDTPIMIFDYFELSDFFIALMIVMVFGVLFFAWKTMFGLLVIFLGAGPAIKRRNEKGIFLHWPYRHLRVSLPGILNPGGRKKYSD